jgi:uncharacterized protein
MHQNPWCIFFCTETRHGERGRCLKEEIKLLIELQGFDSELRRISLRKNELPGAREQLDEELRRFEEAVEECRKRTEDLQKAHRDREKDLKGGLESVKKAKSRLLEVKTNKEYEAILKEIDTFNQKNSAIEDEILNLLEENEKAGGEIRKIERELEEVRTRYDREVKALDEEIVSLEGFLAAMAAKQQGTREKIDPEILKKYDLIREKRNGQAVVAARKEVCSGCHMNIPPQMYNELQTYEKLYVCPSCNRIIYWENRDDGA